MPTQTRRAPLPGQNPAFDTFVDEMLETYSEGLGCERDQVAEMYSDITATREEFKKAMDDWWRERLLEIREELWPDWPDGVGERVAELEADNLNLSWENAALNEQLKEEQAARQEAEQALAESKIMLAAARKANRHLRETRVCFSCSGRMFPHVR